MKKTLIALAALAAGSAFAQSSVTLSGGFAAGYESTKSATGVKASGLFNDTAAIKLTATEDLGGGLKATAVVSAGGLKRGGNVGGEDAYIQFDGGFGSIKLGTVEAASDTAAAWIAPGAYGLDGKVFSSNVTVDTLGWTSADMSGVKLSASVSDYSTATAGTAGAGGLTNSVRSQPSATFGVSYAAGALSLGASYGVYLNKDNVVSVDAGSCGVNTNTGAIECTATTAVENAKTKTKLNAAYDFGVAKVAAQYYTKSYDTSSRESGYSLGVSVPVSANFALGAQYGKLSPKDNGADKTGYALGAVYSLSKRTNISTSYASWKAKGADSATAFRVLVGHSF